MTFPGVQVNSNNYTQQQHICSKHIYTSPHFITLFPTAPHLFWEEKKCQRLLICQSGCCPVVVLTGVHGGQPYTSSGSPARSGSMINQAGSESKC